MKRTTRSFVALGAASTIWVTVACLDVSSPVSGISGITPLLPPTPSIVAHDSLRDTAGRAAPLRVYAFGPNGDTLRDVVVRFYVVDSTHKLHVDSISGLMSGDSLAPNAAVFARVRPTNGKGFLDTPLDTIPIIPVPVAATSDTNFLFSFAVAASDTNSATLISPAFGVTVHGNADTLIRKYPVVFRLSRSPAQKAADAGPTLVLISSQSTNDSTVAITDATGHATLRLRIRLSAIADSLHRGEKTDTAVVKMFVRYRDSLLTITPADSIIIALHGVIP